MLVAARPMDPISDIASWMQRIYQPRGSGTIAAHLKTPYGIPVNGITTLDVGVYRVDRDDGDAWVARVMAPVGLPCATAPFAAEKDTITASQNRRFTMAREGITKSRARNGPSAACDRVAAGPDGV